MVIKNGTVHFAFAMYVARRVQVSFHRNMHVGGQVMQFKLCKNSPYLSQTESGDSVS